MAPNDARQQYHLHFVSTPTADTAGTMAILHFDNKRYMFGRMSEGTQRTCVQRGVSVKKVRNVFLTGTNTWADNGGLIGFMLTVADQQLQEVEDTGTGKRPRLHIHGGPKLLHTVACARRFVFRTGVPLAIHESTGSRFQWPSEPSYVDDNIRVWSIALSSNYSNLTINGMYEDEGSKVQSEQHSRQKIVSDMFDSEWRRDRLVEVPFSEVRLPAMIWIRDPTTKELHGTQCISMEDAPHIQPDQLVQVRNPWPASLVGELPSAANLPAGIAMSYIVRGHSQRGTFDARKANELKLPNGPVRGHLAEGDTITLEDGRVITPDMVLGPMKVGSGIAFFDLPTVSHLQNLQELINSNADMLENVAAAVWTLGPDVGSTSTFQEVLQALPSLKHFCSDPDTAANILAFESVAASNSRLSRVAPELFPDLHYDNDASYYKANSQPNSLSNLVAPANAGLRISIEPKFVVDSSDIPTPLTPSTIESATSEAYLSALSSLPGITLPKFTNEPTITTLGTGSALPSKYRNVSSTLITLPNAANFLLDCGENTIGQLRRMYTSNQLIDVLLNMKAIWISHLHADHHLGTISVLLARAAAFDAHAPTADRTIYLMSEQNELDFVQDYSSVEPRLLTSTGLFSVLCNKDGVFSKDNLEQPFIFPPASFIHFLQTCRVSHCYGAQAISLTLTCPPHFDTFKVSYSGDCRPSAKFCEIGADSDVLIHEATFDDGMEGDAMAKKHSTTSEALGVALKMRAKTVVLTHFSQRYQKVPNLENVKVPKALAKEEDGETEDADEPEEAGPVDDGAEVTTTTEPGRIDAESNEIDPIPTAQPPTQYPKSPYPSTFQIPVCVAFDHMRISPSQIPHAKQYYPAIQAMFDDMEAKSEARKLREKEKMEQFARDKRERGKKQRKEGETGGKKMQGEGARGNTQGHVQGEVNGTHQQPNANANANADFNELPKSKSQLKREARFQHLQDIKRAKRARRESESQNQNGSSDGNTKLASAAREEGANATAEPRNEDDTTG